MTPASSSSEIVLYTTPDGTVKIDTVFQDEIIPTVIIASKL
jgi:hypothetical protein